MLLFFFDEIYDFWTAWARESPGLGIVKKKAFQKNIFFCFKWKFYDVFMSFYFFLKKSLWIVYDKIWFVYEFERVRKTSKIKNVLFFNDLFNEMLMIFYENFMIFWCFSMICLWFF